MLLAAATFVAALSVLTLSVAAEPVKLRVSWVAVPNNLPPIMFRKEGLAKHFGKSYTMEAVQYRGTPQAITALATGDLEMALLSYSSFPLAVQNAKMDDLRIIADEFQDGANGHYSGEFMVLKDGPVKKIEDLKGKTIAVNVKGGATHGAAREVLQKHGLKEGDYNVIEASFSNMRAVLAEKKVDLIAVGIPQFSWDADLQAIARPLFTQKDAFGESDVVIWVARADFLAKNRAAVVDFFEDMLRARRFFIDPANRAEAIKIVSEFTKAPPAKLQDWVFTKKDYYRDPNSRPNVKALQSNLDQLHKSGGIKEALDVKKYLDLSLLEEAIARSK
jgi:NitT/TauT family transport system substrate-binding protein